MSEIINAFLQIVLLSSVMITIVILAKSLFAKRVSPSIMAVLWIIILLRLTLPITIESPIQITSTILPTKSILTDNVISNNQDVTTNINDKPDLDNNSADTYNEEPIKNTNNIPSTAKNNDTQISKQDNVINKLKGISLYELIFILWCIGAVYMLLKAIAVTMGFNRKLKKCRALENPLVLNLVTRQKNELAIKKTIRIVECDHVDVPMVFGYFKPNLLIPKKYLTKNENNLYYILLHEMCHIARHDILKNYLWLFAKVIHWFNPLVYIAYKMYQDNIELCCDQMVVHKLSKDDKYRYSQTLVDVIRMSSRKNPLPAAASLCTSKSVLKERVLMMIQPRNRSRVALVISLVFALAMIVGGFTTACMPKAIDISSNIVLSKKVIQKIRDDKVIHSLEVPETWKEDIKLKDLDVHIDANIFKEKLPYGLYEVVPQDVNQKHIDKMVDYLIGDEKLYYRGICKTKSEVEKELEKLSIKFGNLSEKNEKLKSIYSEQIEIRKKALQETVDESVRFQFDINIDSLGFIELDELDEFIDSNRPYEEIYSIINNIGEVDLGKAIPATLELDKKSGTFRFNNFGAQTKDLTFKRSDSLDEKKESLGEDEYQDYFISLCRKYGDQFDDFIKNVGYEVGIQGGGYVLSVYDGETLISDECHFGSVLNNRLYTIRNMDIFTRPLLANTELCRTNYFEWIEESNKDAPWPNIQLYMISGETGVLYVEKLVQSSKFDYISKGLQLLDFEEVKKIFKKNVLKHGKYNIVNDSSNGLNINEIVLSYKYVAGKEYEDQVIMMPVWYIFGEAKSDISYSNKNTEYPFHLPRGHQPIMTINAIDGTIISR